MKTKLQAAIVFLSTILCMSPMRTFAALNYSSWNATPEQAAYLEQKYGILPKHLQKLLAKWNVILCAPGTIIPEQTGLASNEVCGGLTEVYYWVYEDGHEEISRRNMLLTNDPSSLAVSIIHEFGHAVDKEYEERFGVKASATPEFAQIFALEKNKVQYEHTAYYFMTVPNEYFAEAFRLYFERPTALANAPATATYLAGIIGQLK